MAMSETDEELLGGHARTSNGAITSMAESGREQKVGKWEGQ